MAFRAAYSHASTRDHTFPLCHWQALSAKGKALGKTPRQKNWTKDEFPFDDMVSWMEQGNNVGFRLGEGWAVIDYDPRRDPAGDALKRLCADFGIDLAKCFVVETGGGGSHVYLRIPLSFRGREQIAKYPGVELKHSARRYVVALGSIHPGDEKEGIPPGRRYTLREGSAPLDQTLAAPGKLLKLYEHIAPPPNERGSGPESFGNFTPDQLTATLTHIPADTFRAGADPSWEQFMMSCHWATGGEGREEFVAWSISDPAYADHEQIIRKRWDSLTPRADSIKSGLIFKTLDRHNVSREDWPTEGASVLFADTELSADELDPPEAMPPGVSRFEHITVHSADALRKEIGEEPPGMDGLFNARAGSIYVIYGPPGHGKTQASVALGKTISHGDRYFAGRRQYVTGDVLFIALDDEDSILKADLAHTLRAGPSKGRFDLIVDDPRFEREESWAAIEKACAGYKLVFIDTLSTALPTGDPDKSNFVSQFYTRLKGVGRKVGCFFIILHHTPKDQPTVARNAGSIIGNANGSICIHKPDGDDGLYSEMKGMKVRGERTPPIYFAVESVEIGYDALRDKMRTGGFVVPVDPKELKSDRAFYDIADWVIRHGERREGEYVMTLKDFRQQFGRKTHTEGVLKDWPGRFTGADFDVDYVPSQRRNEPHLIIARGTLPHARRDTWKPSEMIAQDELNALKADPDFIGLV